MSQGEGFLTDMKVSEFFTCRACGWSFYTICWIATQKTTDGKVQKRKQAGCPKCHSSVSKEV